MRFRKLAGLVAGALVSGLVTTAALATPAQAADGTTTKFVSAGCAYSSFKADLHSDYDVTVSGTSVTVDFDSPFNPGWSSLQFSKLSGTMQLAIGDQTVTVTGEKTFSPTAAGNTDMVLPQLTGTLPATPTGDAISLTSVGLGMTIQYGAGTMTCTQDVASSADFSCSYENFKMFYSAQVHTRANGTAVSANIATKFSAGMPAFLSIASMTPTVGVTVDGEAVSLTGSKTYATPIPGNQPLPVPSVSGTRTGTAAVAAVSVNSFGAVLKINGSDYTIPCVAYTPSTTSSAAEMVCSYSSFAMPISAALQTTFDRTAVTGELGDVTLAAMPANFLINSAKATVDLKAGTTPLTLESPVQTFATPLAGNAAIPLPDVTGTTSAVMYPTATTITGLTMVLNIKTPYAPTPSNATVTCAVPVATSTALTATSTTPNAVNLTATVTPTGAAGSVQFKQDGTNVGAAVPVASGVANLALTEVAAGARSYTAVFTPTAAKDWSASTSPAANVTVKNPVVATSVTLTGTSPTPGTATLVAKVAPATAGSVAFLNNGVKVGTVTVASGSATLALKGVKAGTHSYQAVFTPSAATHSGSQSAKVSVVVKAVPVVKAATKIKVKAAGSKGKAVVKITVTGGKTKATGKVTLVLKKGKTTKKVTVKLKSGAGKATIKKLKKGTWKIAASYAGDATHKSSKAKSAVKVK